LVPRADRSAAADPGGASLAVARTVSWRREGSLDSPTILERDLRRREDGSQGSRSGLHGEHLPATHEDERQLLRGPVVQLACEPVSLIHGGSRLCVDLSRQFLGRANLTLSVGVGRLAWRQAAKTGVARKAALALATMLIRLEDPALVPDLLAFLERVRCAVGRPRGNVLEVCVPEAPTPEQARLELELYLLAWRALHPDAAASLVSSPVLMLPQAHL
jgi:hypothetical protein